MDFWCPFLDYVSDRKFRCQLLATSFGTFI
jgi:hypothetical protein